MNKTPHEIKIIESIFLKNNLNSKDKKTLKKLLKIIDNKISLQINDVEYDGDCDLSLVPEVSRMFLSNLLAEKSFSGFKLYYQGYLQNSMFPSNAVIEFISDFADKNFSYFGDYVIERLYENFSDDIVMEIYLSLDNRRTPPNFKTWERYFDKISNNDDYKTIPFEWALNLLEE